MGFASSALHDGPVAVVVLDGELDLAVIGEVEVLVGRCIADGATHVVVDATRLTFCDSNGLGTLLRCARTTGPGRFFMGGVSGGPRRLVDLTGTAEALGVRADVQTALTEAAAAAQAASARHDR